MGNGSSQKHNLEKLMQFVVFLCEINHNDEQLQLIALRIWHLKIVKNAGIK
jgi:hypothetical protein